MSMTIFRSDCRCFLVKFWKMSQFSSCRSLKPTARWWFSNTDESLYIKASSESAGRIQILILVTVTWGSKFISWHTQKICTFFLWHAITLGHSETQQQSGEKGIRLCFSLADKRSVGSSNQDDSYCLCSRDSPIWAFGKHYAFCVWSVWVCTSILFWLAALLCNIHIRNDPRNGCWAIPSGRKLCVLL